VFSRDVDGVTYGGWLLRVNSTHRIMLVPVGESFSGSLTPREFVNSSSSSSSRASAIREARWKLQSSNVNPRSRSPALSGNAIQAKGRRCNRIRYYAVFRLVKIRGSRVTPLYHRYCHHPKPRFVSERVPRKCCPRLNDFRGARADAREIVKDFYVPLETMGRNLRRVPSPPPPGPIFIMPGKSRVRFVSPAFFTRLRTHALSRIGEEILACPCT